MLFHYLERWAPFRIDALGLVTLLGAERVDQVVGRLAHHRLTSYLPLLGAFKIAGNDFVQPIPGFVLYNVTDGIVATDLSGWFCRWLLSQELTYTSTTLTISEAVGGSGGHRRFEGWCNYALGMLATGPLLAMAILMGDWWGLVNVASMAISVLVRLVVVGGNYAAIDRAVDVAAESSAKQVKVIVTLPTGELITVRTTVGIVLNCILTNPRLRHPKFYNLVRAIGWVGFGCHVISLGMAALLNQLLTVVVVVGATALVVWKVGDDESRIGKRLRIHRSDHPPPDWRATAISRLQLSRTEEDCLLTWNLLPQRSNEIWWQTFRQCQEEPELFKNWSQMLKDAHLQADAAAEKDGESAEFACKAQVSRTNSGSDGESGDLEACVCIR